MNNRPFTAEEQKQIITHLISLVKDKHYMSSDSKQLARDLQSTTLSTEERFTRLQTYMSKKENIVKKLGKSIDRSIYLKITRDAIKTKNFDVAYRNFNSFHLGSPIVIGNLITKSILAGAYVKEYAAHWDMTKVAYRNNFIRFEASKTDHDPLMAIATLGTSLAVHAAVKSSFSFFSYQGRHFNEAPQVMQTFNRLNTMHNLPEGQKKTIFLAIMEEYKSGFCFKKSRQSQNLLNVLQNNINNGDITRAWEAMVKYVVKNETLRHEIQNARNVSSNNGKRLYNIIVKQLEIGNEQEMRHIP